jgi:hypothetical protein
MEANLIAQVRQYAADHYTDGGWDVLVECWDDSDIADAIGKATTLRGALRKLSAVIDVYSDHQANARNSTF